MEIVYIVAPEGEPPTNRHGHTLLWRRQSKCGPATMKAIADGAKKIVNFGTAGLVKRNKGLEGLVQVSLIVQRDMQAESSTKRFKHL